MSNITYLPQPEYRLQILPGRCPPGFPHVDFHNQVYAFWKESWAKVFAENNTNSQPDANLFYRQDFVAVVTRGSRIVGTLFFTENNLRSDVIQQISYFNRPHVAELAAEFRAKDLFHVATYEMLTVAPDFRRRETGISFGSVLLGLVVNAFRQSSTDVMIGPVRLDNGVDQMVREFGWELVSEAYSMHGTPVAVSALFKQRIRETSNEVHRNLIRKLWANRVDLRTGNSLQPSISA